MLDRIMERIDKKILKIKTEQAEATQKEIEEFKKKSLFSIEQDNETGVVTISPMNKERNIVLHGEEWVRWFIALLQDTIQQ